MKRKSILTDPLFYFLAAVLWIMSSVSFSASAQLIKLNVGYSAISGEQLPAWIAKETRIFEKNGLDVQLIYFTGGTTAVLALVSGEVPISQVAGSGCREQCLGRFRYHHGRRRCDLLGLLAYEPAGDQKA